MNNTAITPIIRHAITLSQISLGLGVLAMLCFVLFGTLASLKAFHDSTAMYYAFYYLPYVLIGLSVPINLYHAFLIRRYRLMQTGILHMVLITALILSVIVPFIGAVAWLAMTFLFKVSLKRFLNFLTQSTPKGQEKTHERPPKRPNHTA